MITKLESNLIKSFLFRKKEKLNLVAVAADKTILKIDKDTNKLLEIFLSQYKASTGNTKIGKSAYLHVLLKQFAYDQRALIRYAEIDPKVFNEGVLPALQTFKKIMKSYICSDITDQTSAVTALVLYSMMRAYEVANNMKVDDYLDNEYYDEEYEYKRFSTPQMPPLVITQDITELFEDDEVLKPPKLVTVPAFPARGDK